MDVIKKLQEAGLSAVYDGGVVLVTVSNRGEFDAALKLTRKIIKESDYNGSFGVKVATDSRGQHAVSSAAPAEAADTVSGPQMDAEMDTESEMDTEVEAGEIAGTTEAAGTGETEGAADAVDTTEATDATGVADITEAADTTEATDATTAVEEEYYDEPDDLSGGDIYHPLDDSFLFEEESGQMSLSDFT